MRLSRTLAYALQATLQLARQRSTGVPIRGCVLAAEGGIPERFLLQVLRGLVQRGILRSTRGAGGGYFLHRNPAEISLLEMIEAIDGPLVTTFPSYEGLPLESKSKLTHALSGVTEQARRDLHLIKLAHLLPSSD
ncbi:MAG: Rrf2 family transcriptional regulator [Thermoguttaceae bacterium]